MAAACRAARRGRSGQRAQSYHRASTPPARATSPKQPTIRGCAGIFVQAGVPVKGIARQWLGGSSADDKAGVSGWIWLQSNNYWSGTEYAPNSGNAWNFNTNNGNQNNNNKNNGLYAMAVRPGG